MTVTLRIRLALTTESSASQSVLHQRASKSVRGAESYHSSYEELDYALRLTPVSLIGASA
jgi:hypothetical protein